MHEDHLAELRAALTRVRRRWVAARALRAVARVMAGIGGVVLVLLVVELWLAPPDLAIVLLGAAALLATLVFATRLLWPLRKRPNDQRVARLVEERCPEFEDRVASATELVARDGETAFHRLVVADAAAKLREMDPAGVVVPPAQLRAAVVRGVLAIVALLALLAFGGDPIGRVARTAWLFAFPADLTLVVEPGDVQVSAGQPVTVRVRLRGRVSAPVRTSPTLMHRSGDESRMVQMRAAHDGDGYVAEFPDVTESFTYRVSVATLRSRVYKVDAMVAPRIRRVDVAYLYPAFTGLAPRVEEDGGDVYAPAGTTVRLTVYADAPVVAGRLVFNDGRKHTLEAGGADTFQGTFTVETDGEYTLSVTDSAGLSSPDDIGYFIRATADRPPEVQVLRPRGDQEITSLEEVTIAARADDDYRIGALELLYTVAGRAERVVSLGPADAAAAPASVTGRYTLFAEDLDLSPGDFLTYYARARDVGYTGHANEVRSDIFFLEVRPFDNEFEEAQSQSATGQDAERLGDLAAVQKEIIVATWRLDAITRTEAVDDDIQAVARAQAELRGRTSSAADTLRGRGRGNANGATGRPPQQVAMSAAVAAMAAAHTALQGMRTGAALPSEMEALNQLLRAQAEVRRQQVSSQSGQGAQTPGTQAQEDLSELFDRELRRDQETNYETGSRSSGSDKEELSETLRRLRELAERQAEVNRQLDRSSDETPEEARRRALERLTREQQALREQLEQLAQEFGDTQRRGGGGQGGQTSGEGLDRAAEQMRRATSELRREDPEQARAQGQQVVDELRRVEQRLRGEAEGESESGDDEHGGAVAESALEARQIAEAQRQVAAETAEVAAGNRTDESRARLADGKDRLADRVDALGDQLRELSQEPEDAPPGGAVGSVLDALTQEDVGRRMRAGAERLRVSPAGGDPDAEASLAEVLAEIADQLGRAGSEDGAEVRRLVEQLDAVQELRQALQRLGADQGGADSSGGPAESADPRSGDRSAEASSSPSAGAGGLRREYMAGLERHPGLVEELRQDNPELRRDLDAWAEHRVSGAAPGAEASKRDFATWESLRRNLDTGLQRLEDAHSRDLAATDLRDRVTGGSEEPVPARYQRLVDQYYRALATEPVSP